VQIAGALKGYSASDINNVCKDAAKMPLKRLLGKGVSLKNVSKTDIGPIEKQDFIGVTQMIKSSVNMDTLLSYKKWNDEFGSGD